MPKKRRKKKTDYLPITEFGNPVLRKPTRRVPKGWARTPSARRLIERMRKTMHRARGVGIASTQVGRRERVAVIEIPEGDKRLPKGFSFTVIVNPRILRRSKEEILGWEGCLSLRAVRGKAPRARSISVLYSNAEGKEEKRTLRGFPAVVFQHEIDHLDGVLYVDRMRDMKTLMSMVEFEKRVRKGKK